MNAANGGTSETRHSLDYARRLYEEVSSWYTSADNKAQILLTLNGVFLGFFTSTLFMESAKLVDIWRYFGLETTSYLGLMAGCIAVSIFSALMCLRSRLPKRQKLTPSRSTMWFFGHISDLATKDFEEGIKKVDCEYERDTLAKNISVLSRNVLAKHTWVNRGFALLIAGLLSFLLMSISYFIRLTLHPIEFIDPWLSAFGVLIPLVGLLTYRWLKKREDDANMPL